MLILFLVSKYYKWSYLENVRMITQRDFKILFYSFYFLLRVSLLIPPASCIHELKIML